MMSLSDVSRVSICVSAKLVCGWLGRISMGCRDYSLFEDAECELQ